MRSTGKLVWLLAFTAFSILMAGCGGVSVSKTVSPLDFVMPGLLKADPSPAHPQNAAPAAEPLKPTQLAQN